jgi:hypothetical protein
MERRFPQSGDPKPQKRLATDEHSAAVGCNQVALYIAPPSHPLSCHSRESGNPGPLPRRFPPHQVQGKLWMPAFAGMTMVGVMDCDVKNLRKPRRFWRSVVQINADQ